MAPPNRRACRRLPEKGSRPEEFEVGLLDTRLVQRTSPVAQEVRGANFTTSEPPGVVPSRLISLEDDS